jgi:hypothetical protein
MKSKERCMRFELAPRTGYYSLVSAFGKDFAIIDTQTTKQLDSIIDLSPPFTAEAVLISGDRDKFTSSASAKKQGFVISINLYGSRHIYNELGVRLSKARAFLQHPYAYREDVEYDNPHYFKDPDGDNDLDMVILTLRGDSDQSENVANAVNEVLESLDNPTLEEIAETPSLPRTALMK